ncbi:MAG: hypothetical protein M0Z87_06570 [Actinomycetota bacterium]|nr:hypothetical protein [Actinomycetota bacterium]
MTINGSGFGATQGSGYVKFSDNGTNWGAPGDAATFHVNSWSNTSVTFTVPTGSGTNNTQWTVTPGTTATVTVTNASGQTSNSASMSVS